MDEDRLRHALSAGTGLVPDPPDPRDYTLSAAAPVAESSVFYDKLMTPVRDQGMRPTCVGFSSTAVKEYYDNKERGTNSYFSPNHLYYLCKQQDGDPNGDGTSIRVAMSTLLNVGVAPEPDWPYTDPASPVPDLNHLNADAQTQKIKTYARLTNTRDMVSSLLLNGPFVLGIVVTDGFYTDQAIHAGIIDATVPAKDTDGGHAIAVTGYDASRKWFRIKNSWGTEYGDRGYIWLPRDWVDQNMLDAWAIVDDETIDSNLIIHKPVPPAPAPKPRRIWHFPPFRDPQP